MKNSIKHFEILLWVIILTSTSFAAIVRTALGHNNEKPKSSVTSWTALSSVALATGDTLVVAGCADVSFSIQWNSLNADSPGNDNNISAGGVVGVISRWTSQVGAGGTGNIVFSFSPASTAHAMFATKLTGLTSTPLDVNSGNSGSSASPSDSGTSTNQASEIFIGNLCTNGPSGDAAGTWSNSWSAGQRDGTTGGSASTNWTSQEGFKTVSATESSQAALTSITSRAWTIQHVTYKANTSITTPHGLLTVGVGMAAIHRSHLNHYICNLEPCGDMIFARR